MSHKVYITNKQKAVKVPSGLRILIRRACHAVLEYEHFEGPAEISVTFVDDEEIARLNEQYRNKPQPTDVLSLSLIHIYYSAVCCRSFYLNWICDARCRFKI